MAQLTAFTEINMALRITRGICRSMGRHFGAYVCRCNFSVARIIECYLQLSTGDFMKFMAYMYSVCVCVCDFILSPKWRHQYGSYLLYIRATNGIFQNFALKYERPLTQRSLISQYTSTTLLMPDIMYYCWSQRPHGLRCLVCGRSPAEIVGLNPAGGMDICLLWVLYVVR